MAAQAEPAPSQPEANGVCSVSSGQEARVDELVQRISPCRHSESRRQRVASYVVNIIQRCFAPACEVKAFMFGSVPLRTYLPDGDIDLAVFQKSGPPIREFWFKKLGDALEAEQRRSGHCTVRDVQSIAAEVRLLKCLVDDIVVDISFETLGGLCTVAFLESIDRKLQENNLFKRSIILVKAWCYYESRLLGAHHGLLSTYALETMVLYLLNSQHRELNSPLKVLHKFLDFFGDFDWDQYCLSLQGPISLTALQESPGPPPRSSQKSPRLPESFHAQMVAMYSSVPTAPARAFQRRCINIMDPLAPSNNLGRSVSRASYLRLRKALKRGAVTLAAAAVSDEGDSTAGIDHFLKSAWVAVHQREVQNGLASAHENGYAQHSQVPQLPAYWGSHSQPGQQHQHVSASGAASPPSQYPAGGSPGSSPRREQLSRPGSTRQQQPALGDQHQDALPLDWRDRPPQEQALLQAHHAQALQLVHMQLPFRGSMGYPVMQVPLSALPMGYPHDPRLYMYPPQPQQPGQGQPEQRGSGSQYSSRPSSRPGSRPASPAPPPQRHQQPTQQQHHSQQQQQQQQLQQLQQHAQQHLQQLLQQQHQQQQQQRQHQPHGQPQHQLPPPPQLAAVSAPAPVQPLNAVLSLNGDLEQLSQNLGIARICLSTGDSRAASPPVQPAQRIAAAQHIATANGNQGGWHPEEQVPSRSSRGTAGPGSSDSAISIQPNMGPRSRSDNDLTSPSWPLPPPPVPTQAPPQASWGRASGQGMGRSEWRGPPPPGPYPPARGPPAPVLPSRQSGLENGQLRLPHRVATSRGSNSASMPSGLSAGALSSQRQERLGSRSLGGSPLAHQVPDAGWPQQQGLGELTFWPPPPPHAPPPPAHHHAQAPPSPEVVSPQPPPPGVDFVMRDDEFPSLGGSVRPPAEPGASWRAQRPAWPSPPSSQAA